MPYFSYKDRNVYYREMGKGTPLLLLHGNSVSSKMFDGVLDFYKDDFKLILVDFLGHGKSDRLMEFPTDFWYEEAMQIIQMLEQNGYGKVNIIGTSGGALVALNVALESSELINKVIADSFEGEKSLDGIAKVINDERKQAKSSKEGCAFWEYCHGNDWEKVVDNDTDAIIEHDKYIKDYFHKDLSRINVPVMLTASHEDEFAKALGIDFNDIYGNMIKKITGGRLYLFQTGGHPAMISRAKEFSDIAKKYLAD